MCIAHYHCKGFFYSTDAYDIDNFFVFEQVICPGSEDGNRSRKLISHFAGDALRFYFDIFVENAELTSSASNYNEVKATFRKRFGKVDTWPERIIFAVNATIQKNNLTNVFETYGQSISV